MCFGWRQKDVWKKWFPYRVVNSSSGPNYFSRLSNALVLLSKILGREIVGPSRQTSLIWKNISLTIESNVSVILRIIGFGHGCTIFVYCQIQSLRFSTKKISKAHLSIRFHFTKEPCDCKYSYQSTRIENWQPLNIQTIKQQPMRHHSTGSGNKEPLVKCIKINQAFNFPSRVWVQV